LKYSPSKILSEFEILANEILDKDILEKSFEKLIEWITENQNEKFDSQFLKDLSSKFEEFLSNAMDQIPEMNYNSISKIRLNLRNASNNMLIRDVLRKFDDANGLMKKIDAKFNSLIAKLAEDSKKIKKIKQHEKKQKLYDAEKKERFGSIDEANSLLADDLRQSTKKEEYKVEPKIESKIEAKYLPNQMNEFESKIEIYN
jgi:hypothetical protein